MTDHRKLLMNISDHLTSEDFAKLKYICKEDIPAGIAENITRPFDFFAKLERKGFLSEGNYDYLAPRLRDIGRIDLKEKLLEIIGKDIYVLELVECTMLFFMCCFEGRSNRWKDVTKPVVQI